MYNALTGGKNTSIHADVCCVFFVCICDCEWLWTRNTPSSKCELEEYLYSYHFMLWLYRINRMWCDTQFIYAILWLKKKRREASLSSIFFSWWFESLPSFFVGVADGFSFDRLYFMHVCIFMNRQMVFCIFVKRIIRMKRLTIQTTPVYICSIDLQLL